MNLFWIVFLPGKGYWPSLGLLLANYALTDPHPQQHDWPEKKRSESKKKKVCTPRYEQVRLLATDN